MDSEDQIDLLQIFEVLWRGKWRILLCMIVAVFIGGYYAFKVAEPVYSSTARLVLQVNNQQVIDIASVVSGVSTEEEAINTELQIILSRDIILELIRDLKLVEDPEFNERLNAPSRFSVTTLKNLALSTLGIQEEPELPPTAAELELELVKPVRKTINVAALPNTYLYSIRVRTQDPKKSADMANRLAAIYLEDQIKVKFATTEFAVNWLANRVEELEIELADKEDAIKELRADTELVSLEGLEALNIRAKDIRQRLTRAEIDIKLSTEKATKVAALLEANDVAGLVDALNDSRLDALAPAALTGTAKGIADFLDRVKQVQATKQADAARELSQRDALQTSYEQILIQTEAQNADLVKLNQLIREADATRVLYETFLTRLKETSVQIGLQRADSRILSGGVQEKQVGPRKGLILAISLFLGATLGIALVFLKQFLHNGFRSSDELEKITGYPVLGQIPIIPIRRRAQLMTYLATKPTSAAAEAIRNLRTSILLSDIDNPPQLIMSTSSIPGEGKTTQSISLAHNLSGLGKSVLLIESDIRRRTFLQYFDEPKRGDLISVVAGDLTLAEATVHSKELNIDILMGEKSPINAADFFSSEKFKAFLLTAREAYDYIVIDTPPVLVVPDARVIGTMTDAIIYSVKWNSTNQHQVLEGLRQLSSVGLRVPGVVLAQIDPRGMKRYGYGGRYGAYSGYGQGYYDT